MITIHAWDRERRVLTRPDMKDIKDLEGVPANEVWWIDLTHPNVEEEEFALVDFLPIHHLTLEDMTRQRRDSEGRPHFPKVEDFNTYLLVIVNPLTPSYLQRITRDEDPEKSPRLFTQLSAIITPNLLITHHYDALTCVDDTKRFLARHEKQVDRGPDYLFHLVLDAAVDQYVQALEYVDEWVDELELKVIQDPDREVFYELLRVKQEIINLRKTLVHEREVLVRLIRGEFDLVSDRERVFYRDVYDHLVRFTELIETAREMVSDLMQSYLASTSNRLNEIMKVLTMISTIVLPMTLISGIYGMNFKHMPELDWSGGYPIAIALMAFTGIGSFLLFRWRKWI